MFHVHNNLDSQKQRLGEGFAWFYAIPQTHINGLLALIFLYLTLNPYHDDGLDEAFSSMDMFYFCLVVIAKLLAEVQQISYLI